VSQKLQSWLIPLAACIVLVIVLWLPFGIKVTGLMEEWMSLHDIEKVVRTGQAQDYSLVMTAGDQRLRPLGELAPILSYRLTPDSFTGFNLVMMLLFIGKGFVLYLIMRRLTRGNKVYSLLVALLFVVFPADSGLFTFRAINIHAGVLEYLLAVYFLLEFVQSRRWWWLIGAWVVAIYALLTYEIAYPLVFVTPLLLIIQEGRFTKQIVWESILWYLAPLVTILYVAVEFTQGSSYQGWLLQHSGLNQSSVLGDMAASMVNAYYRHFVGGWLEALGQLGTPYLVLSLAMLTLILVIGLRMIRIKADSDAEVGKQRYWILALIGFGLIGLGYAPYLVTPYRQLDWRVYYYSSIGGAICIGSLIYLFFLYTKLRPIVFVGVMSVLIGLATLHSLNQHEYYADLGVTQQELLYGIVEQVPHLKSAAPIVVVDETGRYNSNWSLGTSYLITDALDYLYSNQQITAVLCSFDAKTGKFAILPEQHEQCSFMPAGVSLSIEGKQVATYPYDQLLLVRYSADGAQLLKQIPSSYLPVSAEQVYNPAQFVDQTAPPPYRFHTFFSISG